MEQVISGRHPVRWWLIDDWCSPLSTLVPASSWSGWEARYDNDCERGKRTARIADGIPGIAGPLARMRCPRSVATWTARLGYPVEDDATMHGGGLHVTSPGGVLATHLDYDRHPTIPERRRALNLIAFLHPEWRPEWGGALVLCDPLGGVVTRVEPIPGRLAAFEVGDTSYHGVEPVVGPAERVTAAVYYLSAATAANTRQRALFMPNRGRK